MAQLIFTPHAVYKWFRNLVIGYSPAGSETEGFYVDKAVCYDPIVPLKYFKVGTGGPVDPITDETTDLTRDWFDDNILAGNGGKGDLAASVDITPSNQKKLLNATNFPNFGNSASSKVAGVLSVVGNGSGNWWDIPGIAFQIACQLSTGEGNPVSGSHDLNEIGLFDEDDELICYGVFPKQIKDATLTFKANCIAMLKTLDYQLVLLPTTSTL